MLKVMESTSSRVRNLIFNSLRDLDRFELDDDCTQYKSLASKYVLGGV